MHALLRWQREFSPENKKTTTRCSIRMMMLMLFALVCMASVTLASVDRGFNGNIAWNNDLEGSIARAKTEKKPVMLLIHKTWCGACKRLKGVFAEGKAVEELSKKFIMVNLEDSEEPASDAYKPDGGYIPRLFFIDSETGKVMNVINEAGNPSYKYYYSEESQIVSSMNKALEKNGGK